jgi:hypothetical protein
MSNKLQRVIGWDLQIGEDNEPRVRDLDLGARLGFARPAKFRELVKRLHRDGILNDSDFIPTVGRAKVGHGYREVLEYHLTQTGALLAIMRSDTQVATTIARQVVEVFLQYREGLLKAVEKALPVGDARVGDGIYHRELARSHCRRVAKMLKVSVARVHGAIRREFKVPSIYLIRLGEWDRFVATVEFMERECGHPKLPLKLRDLQSEMFIEEKKSLAS